MLVTPHDRFAGALIGAAVGDALGLPREGLSRRRAQRMFGAPPLRHRFVLGRGMISDDTEHAFMTAQALLASGGCTDAFARSLAWRLRGWLLGVPAGVGLGTLRAIVKLWLGFGPASSGVFSAGNGPAMRAPILGVWAAARELPLNLLGDLVRASTRITHSDPRAEEGALVVALATSWHCRAGEGQLGPGESVCRLAEHVEGEQLRADLAVVADHLTRGSSFHACLADLGLAAGVTGYINHTVPAAIFCAFRWRHDFRTAVEEAISAGGDADTLGAIVGGMCGAAAGLQAIPKTWIDGLCEWPRSTHWMRRLAASLAQSAVPEANAQRPSPVPLFWPGLLVRNPAFTAIVLAHGFRRLLPPY